VDEALVLAIGRLTIAAGQVEFAMTLLARTLGKEPLNGPVKLQFGETSQLVQKRLPGWDDTDLELRSWLAEARDFMAKRNATLHLVWLSSDFVQPLGAVEPIALWMRQGRVATPSVTEVERLARIGGSVAMRGLAEAANVRILLDGQSTQ
jgi:hypothetical protein